jgi:hypothetical protein
MPSPEGLFCPAADASGVKSLKLLESSVCRSGRFKPRSSCEPVFNADESDSAFKSVLSVGLDVLSAAVPGTSNDIIVPVSLVYLPMFAYVVPLDYIKTIN